MQKVIFSAVLLCCAASCFAATAFGPALVREEQPNKCFEAEKNVYYSPGQAWELEGCGMATCTLANYTGTPQLMVSYESCGVVSVDPPCYLSEDTAAAYPSCCPQPVCPEGFEQEEEEESLEPEVYQQQIHHQMSEESDLDNEIDDNTDLFNQVKVERENNDLSETRNKKKQEYKATKGLKTDSSKVAHNDADNLAGDEDSYFGSNFYQNSLEDFQNLDELLSEGQEQDRKVSPRFQYADNAANNPSSSYYQWF